MTGNNTRDKLRGLFLAAIMVTSVFVGFIAFAGTAAATNAPAAQQAVEYGSGGDEGGTVDLVFNESVTDASNVRVLVDGNRVLSADNSVTGAGGVSVSDNVVTIDLNGAGVGTSITDITPNRNVTILHDVSSGETRNVTFSTDDDLVDDRDFAGDLTLTSQNIDEDGSTNKVDVFEGEVLALVANNNGDDISVEEEDGALILSGSTIDDDSSVLTIDTETRSGIDVGEDYNVSFEEGTGLNLEKFRVNDLDLTATADSTAIEDDEDLDVDVSAIRGGAPITAELNDTDDVVDELSATIGSDGDVTITFDNESYFEEPGDYRVDVVDNQTGIEVSTDTIVVTEAGEGEADFGQIAPEQRGDIVGIPITMSDTDTATVRFGSDDVGYNATVTVEDGDDDGVVGLGWNTYTAGGAPTFGVSDDDDEVVDTDVDGNDNSDVAGFNDILAAGTYELAVVAGDTAPPQESADNLASVSLQERSDSSISLLTAPDSVDPSDVDMEFVRENVGSAITPDSDIAENDHLIVQINAEGLEGVVNATGEDNAARALAGIHSASGDRSGVDLSEPDSSSSATNDDYTTNQILIEAVETDPGPNQDADVVNAEDSGIAGAAVDDDNDTYYVVIDNRADQLTDTDDTYNLEFTIPPYHQDDNSFGLVAPDDDGDFENETVSAEYTIVDEEATVDGPDTLGAPAQSGVTLTGTSTVAPGAELDVQVSTKNEQPSQFINTSTAVVQADGTWSADFGDTFADAVEGTEFDIEVSYENRDLDTDTDEGVVLGDPVTNALTFNDQQVVTEGTQVVTVAEVNLSQGGFIAIHQGGPGGPVIGNSDYIAEDTTRTNIAIALDEQLPQGETTLVAMSHQDTNNNEEYEFDGGAVDAPYPDDAFVSSATITTGQAQPPETEPPETEPPETEPPADDTTTDGAGSPGFGVTAAIVALLGAALLALRRRA